MGTDRKEDPEKANLIKDHLKRAFSDRAAEELPADLMSLIDKLKEQDEPNGK